MKSLQNVSTKNKHLVTRYPLWLKKLIRSKNPKNPLFSFQDADLSGVGWVARFPDSGLITDLSEPFQTNVRNFVDALTAAQAIVSVSSTLRPVERAYLMHWSYRIARNGQDPKGVPAMLGVNIQWWHGNLVSSVRGAMEMVSGYNIVFAPSLTSRHTSGRAIDMGIRWSNSLSIINGNGTLIDISTLPRTHLNEKLHTVGLSYGVHKLVSDPPHWSDDGH